MNGMAMAGSEGSTLAARTSFGPMGKIMEIPWMSMGSRSTILGELSKMGAIRN